MKLNHQTERLTMQVQEKQYGSHPAGEGGEYETLTLSTPLFSQRLKIVESSVVVTDPEPHAVAYLRSEATELEEKPGWVKPSVEGLREMLGLDAGLDGLDENGREHLEVLGGFQQSELMLDEQKTEDALETENSSSIQYARRRRWFAASANGHTLADEGIGDELRRCFDSICGAHSNVISYYSLNTARNSSETIRRRSFTPPSRHPHHPSPLHYVRLHCRQRSLQILLRYLPAEPCYRFCSPADRSACQARGDWLR